MDRQKTADWSRVDRDGLQDLIEALRDYAPAIERDVARLRVAKGDREALDSLFRSLHNVKGDAALCQVELAVAMVHPIESLLARVRRGEARFTDAMAELVLLLVDRLDLAMGRLASGQALAGLQIPAIVDGIGELVPLAASKLDERMSVVIETVTGFRPLAGSGSTRGGDALAPDPGSALRASDDLSFFRSLAIQLESRAPSFKGRTERIVRLALEANLAAGNGIDPTQLEAAVYAHDIGMMFLAERLWLTPGKMTAEERAALHVHPVYAAGLLSRMAGWSEAAEMVAQHHEMPDGKGYPQGLPASGICPGAKLLGIVDAFESVMLKHEHRGRKRSVLLAIAEVNACDRQFAPEWIAPFNQVVRRILKVG
ncbi:MAG TPA: HD domain-containing phosphohydrolase [Candidatus Accumulibacter phosphatis]|nr:HD domain-containing protein [Accumulibacter sp.]HCN67446.1 HD domain-containing protein [Accumulibacter sp.]HRL74424.1 HD domain-containing phosphohydrolase [Candidatus Accumulibacter phosphatis]HRQ95164.1 HD domain-containing phosphohydrolase [Candidatus Accumulibacter phosphatis]